MQQENSKTVKRILLDLSSYFKVEGLKGLAEFLGVTETRIYGWVRNGKITDTGPVLAKESKINLDWLRTGAGSMLSGEDEKQNYKTEQKVVMTIEPGPARKKGSKAEEQQTRQETETIDEEEAIDQTRYILRSDTVYRGALVSNIRAFYQGVKREEEMAGVEEQMIEMRSKMDLMMQMMESLGAVLPGKKRDAQQS